MITPEEYKKDLMKDDYFRMLPALDMVPDTEPVSIQFSLQKGSLDGFHADYNIYRFSVDGSPWIDIEKYCYTPATDALLLLASALAGGASGAWIDLYDYPAPHREIFTDIFFERYKDSDLVRLTITLSLDENIDMVAHHMHYVEIENRGSIPGKRCIVHVKDLVDTLFEGIRLAYGNQLLKEGRSLLQGDYEDFLWDVNHPDRNPHSGLEDEEDPIFNMWQSIAYWNWIRSYPGLFPAPQRLLSFSDFFTEEELRTMQSFTKRDLYAVPDPAPLY